MKLNLCQPANTKRSESAVRFQMSEFTLNSRTATVEVTEPLSVTRDARKEPTAESKRQGWLVRLRATERDNRVAVPRFTLGVNAGVVVALVHRARLGLEAASVVAAVKANRTDI